MVKPHEWTINAPAIVAAYHTLQEWYSQERRGIADKVTLAGLAITFEKELKEKLEKIGFPQSSYDLIRNPPGTPPAALEFAIDSQKFRIYPGEPEKGIVRVDRKSPLEWLTSAVVLHFSPTIETKVVPIYV